MIHTVSIVSSRALVVLLLSVAISVPVYSAPGGASQLVVAQSADITTADPRVGDISIEYSVYVQICDPLVQFDTNSRIVPALATSWRAPNPTTYEFTLRSGAKFHDGTPVTAADVKATVDRMLDPSFKSASASDYVQLIKSTEVVSPSVVRFNLQIPFAGFLNRMTKIFPVSQQAVQRLGDQEFSRHPVCAGAFKFVEWVRDDHILLEAFDGYWGGRPKIDRLIIRPIPQASTRTAALRSGEVDLAVAVPPDQILGIKQDANLKLLEKETGRFEFFFLDTFSRPFDDKRVRQAINYAVDWNGIVRSIMGGYGRRAPGPAMPYMDGYREVAGHSYNPAKAKQLLIEAGYPNGFDLTVETPNGRYFVDREIAQAVVGYLRTVAGINANLQVYEWGQYVGRQRTKQFKMGLWGFVAGFPLFDDVGFHFEPAHGAKYYGNPEVTRLFEQGRVELDATRRRAIYARLTDLIVEEAPWLFGAAIVGTYGANRRLEWEPRYGTDILYGLNASHAQIGATSIQPPLPVGGLGPHRNVCLAAT